MITNYGQERAVGEVWIDSIDGAKVITVAGEGCKDCAFATLAGGACPGTVHRATPLADSLTSCSKSTESKKARPLNSKMANADTLEGAGVNSGNALSAAKIQNNSETTKDKGQKRALERESRVRQSLMEGKLLWKRAEIASDYSDLNQGLYKQPGMLSEPAVQVRVHPQSDLSTAKIQQNSEITKLSSKKEPPPFCPTTWHQSPEHQQRQQLMTGRTTCKGRNLCPQLLSEEWSVGFTTAGNASLPPYAQVAWFSSASQPDRQEITRRIIELLSGQTHSENISMSQPDSPEDWRAVFPLIIGS